MTGRSAGGYSLYELLMSLALAAIVLGVGLPSFGTLVADQRLRAQIDPLFHAIHRARKASITRRRAVTLCASDDGRQCAQSMDWSAGWILFVNDDRDEPPARDDDETLLGVHTGDPGVAIAANRPAFTLRSTELRATNGTLVFCDRAGRVRPRALVVSYTGRPRVALADRRGRPYRCLY